MKKTDLAMIVLIAAVSVGVAYFVASSFLGEMDNKGVKVQTVDVITSIVEPPDPRIFNSNAINPSVEVNINETKTTTDAVESTR
jgi:hypothetical protein